MEIGMLGIGWTTITPVMKKVWGVGKGDSPLNCYIYTVFMTQKGMVRFCDLESADCMLSLFLLSQEWSFLCLMCFAWQTKKKKRLLVVYRVWNWVFFYYFVSYEKQFRYEIGYAGKSQILVWTVQMFQEAWSPLPFKFSRSASPFWWVSLTPEKIA